MSEQTWIRKEYETWDEAFRGLAPLCRQQSVRVADYTHVLFVGACASAFGKSTAEGAARMKGKYADTAYKCGFYHQLGKALVPPEYQIWQKDFSEEERSVYRKYTTDGRLLVAALQERTSRAKEKRTGLFLEQQTKDIPWLMMRESCEQHMERYDGSGFPQGLKGDQISPIAQIVGLAKELDRLSAETVSEHPFEEAFEQLLAQSGTAWSPELIRVLRKNEEACRKVYQKYIQYTMTVPVTIPLVRKREGKPMGLKYRPMIRGEEGEVIAYEAIPWFGGILGRDGEWETAEQVQDMLNRAELTADVSQYLLYEAGDLLVRLRNCRVEGKPVLVQMLQDFYSLVDQSGQLQQVLEDQELDQDQLLLQVREETILRAEPETVENLTRYARQGYHLVLDGYHPDHLPAQRLEELGIRHVRFSPELYQTPGMANTMSLMRQAGFHLLGAGAEDADCVSWLTLCGVEMISGPMAGVPMTEDEVIRDELASMR